MANVLGATIVDNVARHTSFLGIQLLGASGCEVARNFVHDGGFFAGLNLQNCSDANIHHNRFCSNPVAIRLEPSLLPDVWGHAPSRGNQIHHNTFWSNAANVFEEDPFATDTRVWQSVEHPDGCNG